jgi:hypothetical protein
MDMDYSDYSSDFSDYAEAGGEFEEGSREAFFAAFSGDSEFMALLDETCARLEEKKAGYSVERLKQCIDTLDALEAELDAMPKLKP